MMDMELDTAPNAGNGLAHSNFGGTKYGQGIYDN
jgi:hypothetical protein